MNLSKQQFTTYIKQFQFRKLLNEMGWDNDRTTEPIVVDNTTYTLQAVAEKSGFKILVCQPTAEGHIPDYNTRKKIETKVTKLFHEHLIIFCDAKKTEQIWQLVVRQAGKPTKLTETRYHISQSPELLYQRASGIFFAMDEEESITIVDVTDRMTKNFHANAEKVTKKFYDGFKKEHTSFLDFIKGIDEKANQEWYASLMLNRLMFCYFIQKKGFLDNNKNYLRDKFHACQEKKGENKFYSFYRDFLLVLFHQGLNEAHQTDQVRIEIGRIPYLNGGLFDVHELEKTYEHIEVDDKAFERIFDFFDDYEWHLDTRENASGKDINPDVIGYIFEKYINDRAQMGAYYTKEDITGYIGKNCIIPYLFDETKRNYPKAFKTDGTLSEVWQMVKTSGDTYIYDAVKKGVTLALPEEIVMGIDVSKPNLLERRKEWNKPAPTEYALPTEIFREVIERRKRYAEVKNKIDNGEITAINDFITYNLDIRQFAQDCIENTTDPDFLRQYYKAINSVTILDPTCGSGAFLFAALNILEPLYEGCINRMRAFVEDEDRANEADKSKFCNAYKDFRAILEGTQNEHHPNQEYFIYKSIILRNLYGVDIMNEAVEIAKLRLFLKLVAAVEVDYRKPNMGLEPLPDIDFNIKAGNTLIGFATLNDAVSAINAKDKKGQLDFVFDDELDIVKEVKNQADDLARVFKSFKEAQLVDDLSAHKEAKDKLMSYQARLNKMLNEYLAFTYGIDRESQKEDYSKWLESHQPFNWFAEFYEIIHNRGGFDVVIGNPPYVEYTKVNYKLNGFETIKCGNLYPLIIERSLKIVSRVARTGMIIPISSICTDRMVEYQKILKGMNSWNSLYAERPNKLFSGAEVQLVISIFSNDSANNINSTTYHKWSSSFRDFLFQNIRYASIAELLRIGSIPKIGSELEKCIIRKIFFQKNTINSYLFPNGKYFVSYRNAGGRYYKVILNHEPIFKINSESKRSSTYQFLYFDNKVNADSICGLMNSSLFFWYWLIYSDTWHMVSREIGSFPIDLSNDLIQKLSILNQKLMKDLECNSVERKENRNKGSDIVEFTQYNIRDSKPIIDEIDKVLATHYGFTQEELDFIINYDIKYRMGKEKELEENV